MGMTDFAEEQEISAFLEDIVVNLPLDDCVSEETIKETTEVLIKFVGHCKRIEKECSGKELSQYLTTTLAIYMMLYMEAADDVMDVVPVLKENKDE